MMDEQGTLPLDGRDLRDEGVAKVVERLTPAERRRIIEVIADQGGDFEPDDIRAELSAGLLEKLDAFPNAMGGIFLQLANAGKIEKTGAFGHSARPERRHGVVFFWRRVIR